MSMVPKVSVTKVCVVKLLNSDHPKNWLISLHCVGGLWADIFIDLMLKMSILLRCSRMLDALLAKFQSKFCGMLPVDAL